MVPLVSAIIQTINPGDRYLLCGNNPFPLDCVEKDSEIECIRGGDFYAILDLLTVAPTAAVSLIGFLATLHTYISYQRTLQINRQYDFTEDTNVQRNRNLRRLST